ncbi:MAG: ice-binding family protein, partial [bacterium]|nr:ice-binding family protein [bacterium]
MNKKYMKKFNRVSIIVLALVFTIGLAGLVRATLAPGTVDLGTADNFAVLAGSAITDSAVDAGIDIIGDVGLHPTGGASITGLTCAQITGTLYDNNAGYAGGGGCLITDLGGVATLQPAKDDLVAAYTFAAAQIALPDVPTELGGTTKSPGVYHSAAGTFAITGGTTLTLDGGGDPDAVFIFKADTTLDTTGAGNSVLLTNGAQACNVFWQVGTSATLDTTTTFVGTIMARASITDAGGSTVVGRLLADADDNTAGAVTLSDTTVTVPSCAPSLILNKTVDNTGGGTAVDTDWTLTATGAGGSPTNLSGTD